MVPNGERPIRMVIGENIKKYFDESDYSSFTAFADAANIDNIRLKKVFEGEAGVSADKLQLIAYLLDVSTLDLIEDWSD